MVRNWSKYHVRNKPFYEEPMADAQTWSLAWKYVYKDIHSLNKGVSLKKKYNFKEFLLFLILNKN